MSKLLSVLIAAAFITPAFAADAPKPAAQAETKAADASGQLVTPASDAAAMKDAITKLKAAAAKSKAEAKPAEAKQPEAKQPEAKK